MVSNTWSGARYYRWSRRSGSQFENSVMELIKHYTNAVWRNIRVETLLTQTGSTELDIVFYSGGIVYILELKRVRRIVGTYAKKRWTMYGWSTPEDDASEYTASNVIEQNNIHARSLLDLYFAEFKCFPEVVPVIIVPDDCVVPEDLQGDVFTPAELEGFMISHRGLGRQDVSYRLSYLLGTPGIVSQRQDFVDRTTAEGIPIRGRRRI